MFLPVLSEVPMSEYVLKLYPLFLFRQLGQCTALLPHPGPELRLQGHHQGHLQDRQGRISSREVRKEHLVRRYRRFPLPHVRLLPGLLPNQVSQRRQGQGQGARVQRHGRRLRQDHQVRRPRRSVPRLRHLVRRHLHLPRHVLRSVRFSQAHPAGRQQLSHPQFHPGLGCDHHRRTHVLPHRHRPSSHDDDFRTGRQVQGIRRLLPPGKIFFQRSIT